MRCQFEMVDEVTARCKVCGLEVITKDPSKVYALCPGEPRKYPPILEQAKHYVKAVIHHVATGGETCSDGEVEARLAICKTCEKYDQEAGRCTSCGCRVTNGTNAFTNKLRMKSQKCPLKRW